MPRNTNVDPVAQELIRSVRDGIEAVMAERGIDRRELARRLGTTPGFVSHLLTGRRNMTLRTLADIANALDCDVMFRLRDYDAG